MIVPAGLPMLLTATGAEQRRALTLILHESSERPTTMVHHCCPVKSQRESVGWRFGRNWRPDRWSEGRIKWAFSRKA